MKKKMKVTPVGGVSHGVSFCCGSSNGTNFALEILEILHCMLSQTKENLVFRIMFKMKYEASHETQAGSK